MMNASYVMGTRLVVHNAAFEPLAGNSAFLLIGDEVRVHKDAIVDINTIGDEHIDAESFKDLKYNESSDVGEYIMYFNGGISYIEAIRQFDYLKSEQVISGDLLTMKFEIMLFSNDASLGTLIVFDSYQTNSGLIRTTQDVQIF